MAAGLVGTVRLQRATAGKHRGVDRGDGLIAGVQPATDIDGGTDGQHQHHAHQRKDDGDVAGSVVAELDELRCGTHCALMNLIIFRLSCETNFFVAGNMGRSFL